MPVIMRVVGFASGIHCPIAGQYLETFDHNAYCGKGFGTFTISPKCAMQFNNFEAALCFWKQVSDKYPTRADGQPNRPLSATTVTLEEVIK